MNVSLSNFLQNFCMIRSFFVNRDYGSKNSVLVCGISDYTICDVPLYVIIIGYCTFDGIKILRF